MQLWFVSYCLQEEVQLEMQTGLPMQHINLMDETIELLKKYALVEEKYNQVNSFWFSYVLYLFNELLYSYTFFTCFIRS